MPKTYHQEPDYAFHPGETLAETLEELSMTQKQLSERTGRPLKTINEIIKGRAAITADTAIQLERATGVSASFWNSAQRRYEQFQAEQAEAAALQRERAWLRRLPLKEVAALKWIPECSDPVEQLRALLDFFGVAGIGELERMWLKPRAAFRQSKAFQLKPFAVAAWLRAGERAANSLPTAPFDKVKFNQALREIRLLTAKTSGSVERELLSLCASCGVAVVFVPEVPGTRAYGASRWLGPEKALIQLSLRGKTDDKLWFTFFHEAGHLLKHGRKEFFIEADDYRVDPATRAKEREADAFASRLLIPPEEYADLLALRPLTALKIESFARKLGIAPGIVVGRLQHERILTFKQFNGLKRKVQFSVKMSPSRLTPAVHSEKETALKMTASQDNTSHKPHR
jgi:HTH-type transcriptional regulator/antitoxin HigA